MSGLPERCRPSPAELAKEIHDTLDACAQRLSSEGARGASQGEKSAGNYTWVGSPIPNRNGWSSLRRPVTSASSFYDATGAHNDAHRTSWGSHWGSEDKTANAGHGTQVPDDAQPGTPWGSHWDDKGKDKIAGANTEIKVPDDLTQLSPAEVKLHSQNNLNPSEVPAADSPSSGSQPEMLPDTAREESDAESDYDMVGHNPEEDDAVSIMDHSGAEDERTVVLSHEEQK